MMMKNKKMFYLTIGLLFILFLNIYRIFLSFQPNIIYDINIFIDIIEYGFLFSLFMILKEHIFTIISILQLTAFHTIQISLGGHMLNTTTLIILSIYCFLIASGIGYNYNNEN